ncbi:MAG: hypothetical protein Q7I89_02270 [Syntrophales bacterium]|nr:hypothetical protein [Syntrophales bacterium]PKN59787.1 MAG: hypothetical protein CVU53_06435 [Deltaproteobacteria bacterium HGW-Deltaproteobacteria-11]
MKKNAWVYGATVLSFLLILGCGGLRYSQSAPEAKDFRPKKIGLLPADVGTYEEARGVIDDIIAGELVKRKWFQDVVAADTISRQFQVNEEMRKVVVEYVAKLKTVNYSDPELSRRIGELMQVEAFLVVNVDYWQYTMENKDKLAKVGMGLKMIDADTGIVMWKASHHEIETYKWIKPELSKVAKKLAGMMIDEMPH